MFLNLQSNTSIIVRICLVFLMMINGLIAQEFSEVFKQYESADYKGRINIIKETKNDYKSVLFNEFKKDLIQKKLPTNTPELNELNDFVNCIVLFQEHRYTRAIPAMVTLLSQNKTFNFNDSVRLYSCIIEGFVAINNIPKAFEYHNEITEIIESRKLKLNPWKISIPKSRLYGEIGLYSEAIKQNRLEWLSTDQFYKDNWFNANFHNNLGVYFNKSKNADSAIAEFNLALNYLYKVSRKNNLEDLFFIGLIKGNIAQSYMLLNRYNEAVPLLKQDVCWSIKKGDYLNAVISSNELASCFMKLNELDLAFRYIDTAANLLKGKEDIMPLVQNKKLLAEWNLLKGNEKDAASLFRDLVGLKDSFINIEKESQIINQQVTYAVKQKEDEIEQKNNLLKSNELLLEKQGNQKLVLIQTIVFLLILLLMFIYLYTRLKNNQKVLIEKNSEILTKNIIIQDSLKEKEALLKEVHHRVKNNLQIISSLLNIQASKSNNQEVIEELNESKQRILSIALTHEFIYKSGTLAYIQMPDYLEQLIEQLKYLFNSEKNRINVFLKIEMVAFEMDIALPIGLMVNEIVSNSFKHAFDSEGGEIHVQMTRNETQFCLMLSDNGIGFDPSKRNEIESNHIGLELIDSLVDQINGNINMHNVKGTTFEIFFNSSRFK